MDTNTFAARLRHARALAGLTQAELANKVGVVARQLSLYESGSSNPRYATLERLADALNTTASWLNSGTGEEPILVSDQMHLTVKKIPFYNISQITSEILSNPSQKISLNNYIVSPVDVSEKAFGVVIEGDSMTSYGGVSFPPDTIVIFDFMEEVKHGAFALIHYKNSGLTLFKQYIKDGPNNIARSINPTYPPFLLDDLNELILIRAVASINFLP